MSAAQVKSLYASMPDRLGQARKKFNRPLTLTEKIRSDQHVRFLSLDGVAPTKKNVQTGAYPVLRPLYLVRNAQQVVPAIAAFLDFVRSPEGQRIIESITSPPQ